METTRRLNISTDTFARDKRLLEKDGYIFTVVSNLKKTDEGLRRECNEYYVFDHNHRRLPKKNQLFQLRKQKFKNQGKGTSHE